MTVPMASVAMVRTVQISTTAWATHVATEAAAQMWEPTPTTVLAMTDTCLPTAHVKRFDLVTREKMTVMTMQSAITKGQVSTAAPAALATLGVGRSAVTEMTVQGSLASRV